MREAFSDGETRLLLCPDSDFFRYFRSIPTATRPDAAATPLPPPASPAVVVPRPAPPAEPATPAPPAAAACGAALTDR